MADKKNETKENERKNTELVPIDNMTLDEMQMAEQLYSSAGLDPVVNAGLKDYDEKIKQENKLLNKVLGPRESDIRGYGESVARRVAFAVYGLMNRQYGGKMGDLREYINSLQDERDRANIRYDDLMGRVVGILGEEYRQLRSDSNEFMQKLTDIMGEDVKESKIDQKALAESLADIDGLRNRILELTKTNEQTKAGYETQLKEQSEKAAQETAALKQDYEAKLQKAAQDFADLKKESEAKLEKQQDRNEAMVEKLTAKHEKQVDELKATVAGLEARVKELEKSNTARADQIASLKSDYNRLRKAASELEKVLSLEEIDTRFGEELHAFMLEDSKVPDMVIDGVGKFIDFRKYFGLAAVKGAGEALAESTAHLKKALEKPEE